MTHSRDAHMERRRAHGLTYRELAGEFGTSKSTAHRKLASRATERDAIEETYAERDVER